MVILSKNIWKLRYGSQLTFNEYIKYLEMRISMYPAVVTDAVFIKCEDITNIVNEICAIYV